MTVTLTPEMATICLNALKTEMHRLGWCREQKVAKLARQRILEAIAASERDRPADVTPEATEGPTAGPLSVGKGF